MSKSKLFLIIVFLVLPAMLLLVTLLTSLTLGNVFVIWIIIVNTICYGIMFKDIFKGDKDE